MTDKQTAPVRGPRGRFLNAPGPGRVKGSTNKATAVVREAMMQLARGNVGKVQGWLEATAEKDPAKAAELFLRLVEFTVPKLSRSELTGEDGAPIRTQAVADDAVLQAIREIGERVRNVGVPPPADPLPAGVTH